MTQLQAGAMVCDQSVVDLGPIRLTRRRFSLPLRGEGQVAAGTFMLAVTSTT
jgi:hypothetical protein